MRIRVNKNFVWWERGIRLLEYCSGEEAVEVEEACACYALAEGFATTLEEPWHAETEQSVDSDGKEAGDADAPEGDRSAGDGTRKPRKR